MLKLRLARDADDGGYPSGDESDNFMKKRLVSAKKLR